MKKLILAILSVFLYTMIFAQQATRVPSLNKEDYFKKSKNQKTTGIVLLTQEVY